MKDVVKDPEHREAYESLRKAALAYPETYEESPWGDRVVKVRRKVFVFVGASERGFSFTAKLPATGHMALGLDFATPTGYGLGKSGWVTANFAPGEEVPTELLLEWLDESFRAVAPKRLVASMDAGEAKAEVGGGGERVSGRVLLLCAEDSLRRQRGAEAIGARGAKVVAKDLGEATRGSFDLVVADLGRRPPEVLEWVGKLGGEQAVVLVGVRDARQERSARKAVPGALGFLRGAAGEAKNVEAVVEALRGGATRKGKSAKKEARAKGKSAKKKSAKKKSAKGKSAKKKATSGAGKGASEGAKAAGGAKGRTKINAKNAKEGTGKEGRKSAKKATAKKATAKKATAKKKTAKKKTAKKKTAKKTAKKKSAKKKTAKKSAKKKATKKTAKKKSAKKKASR